MKKNIFSKLIVALALVAAPFALSGCDNEDNFRTETVTISGEGVAHHEVTIEKGQTLQLKAATGILAPGGNFVWESSNPAVATIDANGLVKAVTTGQVVITARTTGSDISYMGQITLYVVNQSISVVDDEADQSEAE